jgi:tetratricopeptide (TPR) repeat protein
LHSIHSGLALACFFQAIEELDSLHQWTNNCYFYSDYFCNLQKISKLKLEINNLKQEIHNPGKETKKITKKILSLKKDIKEFENKLQVIKETEQEIEQQINKIDSKLEDAIKQIKKAADIALESQPYIYWNLGLITLAQGKVDKDKVKEVCDAWEKAVIIASNQSDKLCIEIYKYAINALQKPNILTPKQALSKCRQGWLKIILKDMIIISKILDEKNESINNLISILNENIEKS